MTVQEPRVAAELVNDGRQLRVLCPFCGDHHFHGAGDPADPVEYPLYGGRASHCFRQKRGGYVLVPAECDSS